MKYEVIKSYNIPDAWYQTLYRIYKYGDNFPVEVGSEVSNTKKLNVSIEIEHPEVRPLVDDSSPVDMKYVVEYVLRYLWLHKQEALDDSEYTYGDRLRLPIDQINGIMDKYKKSVNDRQATMVLRRPEDINNDNPPCLSLIDTEVFDNKLNLTCYFRSWDAYAGLPSNIAGIQLFNEALVTEINEQSKLNLSTGKLIFHSKNAHIYDRQFKFLEDMFNKKTNRFNIK